MSDYPQKMIDLIYTHTHADYKSVYAGKKSILILGNFGTTIIAIEDLPEAKFYQLWRQAKKGKNA